MKMMDDRREDHTLSLFDAEGTIVRMDCPGPNKVYVPNHSSVPIRIDSEIVIRQVGEGITSIIPEAGVSITGPTQTEHQNDSITLEKLSANKWHSHKTKFIIP